MRARPLPVIAALGAAAVALALGLPGCSGDAGEDLTVIVVSLDTTRPDHLSAFGYARETSPTLARLAREGALFRNMRSSTSWTLPAHMSLFTGLPAPVHDVVIDFQRLDQSRRTMGEIFHDAGYRTMGVYSAPYVHGHFGFDRGMDFYERGTQEPMIWDVTREQMRAEVGLRERTSHKEVTSALVKDRALNLLQHGAADRNLLFLHLFDPHYDYEAPPRYLRKFADPAYKGPVTGDNVSDPAIVHAGMAPADLAQAEALYDAELAWVDDNLGQLVAAIEASGRKDSTVLVVTADHGEEFLEHGRYGHRATLNEEVLRVPCIVWAPGRVKPGTVVEDDVALYDILPTLMDYAGIAPDSRIYGRSLRPLLDGKSLPPRPTTASLTFFPREPQGYYVLHESVVWQGCKLLRRVHVPWDPKQERDLSGVPDPKTERLEFYDLRVDPHEEHDLAATGDPRIAMLREALESERKRQHDAAEAFRPQGTGKAPENDLTLYETMNQLGYLAAPEHAPPPAQPAPSSTPAGDAAPAAAKPASGPPPAPAPADAQPR